MVSGLYQLSKNKAALGVLYHCPLRHFYMKILAMPALFMIGAAVDSPFGHKMLTVLKIQQSMDIWVGFEDRIPSLTAAAAVDIDFGLIYEHSILSDRDHLL